MTSGESETTGAGQTAISDRERFLKACRSEPLDYPPLWMMRQAGRSLPEYMAVKEKHTFIEIVQTPELATEVTLQPIRRFRDLRSNGSVLRFQRQRRH